MAGGAAVAGHGHPARVDDHLALFGLVADDGAEHRACNAVHRHDAEIHHEEVAEPIETMRTSKPASLRRFAAVTIPSRSLAAALRMTARFSTS